MEARKVLYIYVGKNHKGRHCYKEINSLSDNDGSAIGSNNLSTFAKKLGNHALIGAIYEYDAQPNESGGESISFPKENHAVDSWKCEEDIQYWKMVNRGIELSDKKSKDLSGINLSKLLTPIRKAYIDSTHEGRLIIIAEVLNAIRV